MLFICGITDNVSVLVRHTLVQLLTPDEKRGRVSAVYGNAICGRMGPGLGDNSAYH